MANNAKETRQLFLFDDSNSYPRLDAQFWHGSFQSKESTLQQLSPYVGKMKSGMAKVLISLYSKRGEIVLDPFSGSGVVPMEAALSGRVAWANDLSPYAQAITQGKLETPGNEKTALDRCELLAKEIEVHAHSVDIANVPDWVKEFFHPETLKEILSAFSILKNNNDCFLTACLLGILHHVRPGFLSYPASHLVPYLRRTMYPSEKYPEMYLYRNLKTRLIAKVKRAYSRSLIPIDWENRKYEVWRTNSMNLPIENDSVDAIISSPPYFGALDYARDNRLRLWFLGCEDWKVLDESMTANSKVYIPQMSQCIKEMYRVLKPDRRCILVLGDVKRDGQIRRTAEILADMAMKVSRDGFCIEMIYDDIIPDERRSRRKTCTTKYERILVMKKV